MDEEFPFLEDGGRLSKSNNFDVELFAGAEAFRCVTSDEPAVSFSGENDIDDVVAEEFFPSRTDSSSIEGCISHKYANRSMEDLLPNISREGKDRSSKFS